MVVFIEELTAAETILTLYPRDLRSQWNIPLSSKQKPAEWTQVLLLCLHREMNKKFTSTTALNNLLKDPIRVQFDLLPNDTADVLKDNSVEVRGVDCS